MNSLIRNRLKSFPEKRKRVLVRLAFLKLHFLTSDKNRVRRSIGTFKILYVYLQGLYHVLICYDIYGYDLILISSLKELNADYKVDKLKDGDEVIYFMFQAENFSLQVSPDCYFCHMIDPVWHSFDVSDFNELALVKRVINDMNWVSPLNVVYTKSSDEKLYEINTTYNLFVDDSIPYPSYLYKVINDFFITKNTFFRMLAEEHGKEVSDKE